MDSAFSVILQRLVETTPGLLGVVFSDGDGEPVAEWGTGSILDLQIAGAQWRLALEQASASLRRVQLGAASFLLAECGQMQICIHRVEDPYFVVCLAARDCHVGKLLINLENATAELRQAM